MHRHSSTLRSSVRWLVAGAWVLTTACCCFAQQEEGDVRTFADFLAVAEKSKVSYELAADDESHLDSAALVELLWPQQADDGIRAFQVVDKPDGSSLVLRDCSQPAREALDRAEAAFGQGDMTAAASSYGQALEADPGCYTARLFLGDAHLHSRRFDEALTAYEAAIELNPLDYRGHFFRGSALLYLGRQQKAREAFLEALTLKPRHKMLLQAIEARKDLGLRVADTSLEIPIRLELEDGKIGLAVPEKGPWIVFGLCKAVQIGEQEVELGTFSSARDIECFGNLLVSYTAARENDETEADAKLDWLLEVAESDHLGDWIVYEFASRLSPYVTVLLPEEQRASLRQFVREYVLVPASSADSVDP